MVGGVLLGERSEGEVQDVGEGGVKWLGVEDPPSFLSLAGILSSCSMKWTSWSMLAMVVVVES